MLILAAAMAVTVAFVGRDGRDGDLKAATRAVIAAVRQARSAAVLQNRETVLVIDSGSRSLGIEKAPRRTTLPGNVAITALTAESEQIAPGRAGIRFFPSNGSTGGRLTLDNGARKLSIAVDWLSGRVFVEDEKGKARGWTRKHRP